MEEMIPHEIYPIWRNNHTTYKAYGHREALYQMRDMILGLSQSDLIEDEFKFDIYVHKHGLWGSWRFIIWLNETNIMALKCGESFNNITEQLKCSIQSNNDNILLDKTYEKNDYICCFTVEKFNKIFKTKELLSGGIYETNEFSHSYISWHPGSYHYYFKAYHQLQRRRKIMESWEQNASTLKSLLENIISQSDNAIRYEETNSRLTLKNIKSMAENTLEEIECFSEL